MKGEGSEAGWGLEADHLDQVTLVLLGRLKDWKLKVEFVFRIEEVLMIGVVVVDCRMQVGTGMIGLIRVMAKLYLSNSL